MLGPAAALPRNEKKSFAHSYRVSAAPNIYVYTIYVKKNACVV